VFSDPASAFKRWKDTWSAGQGIGQVRGIEPASQIVERFTREYLAARS
jgi:nitronate monooxygenase